MLSEDRYKPRERAPFSGQYEITGWSRDSSKSSFPVFLLVIAFSLCLRQAQAT